MTTPISEFMTHAPHTIGHDQPAQTARDYMRSHSVRHIPVLKGGTVVGIVSDRDLQFLVTLGDAVPESIPVEEAMSQEVYQTAPDTPIKEVVVSMAEHKIGSAVVVEGRKVVGIFTTTDALRALAKCV